MKLPLSILVLAKNEAKVIEDCLRPWLNVASEILVLDTGSSDQTRRLARKMGAKVIRGKWAGDFSRARNQLLDLANEQWIFFLDADHLVSKSDIKKLRSLLRDTKVDAYQLPVRNYTDDYNLLSGWSGVRGEFPLEESLAGTAGYFLCYRHLLFRNKLGIRYEYPVHESILPFLQTQNLRTKAAAVTVHHREFERGNDNYIKKHKKYLMLERRMLRQLSPDSPGYAAILRCMICDVISTGGSLAEADRLTEQLLTIRRDSDALSLSGRVAWLRGNPQTAYRRLRESLEIHASADTLCLLGWLKLEMGELPQARKFLSQALRRREDHPVAYYLKGSLAWENGRRGEAIACMRKALHFHPGYKQAALKFAEYQNG